MNETKWIYVIMACFFVLCMVYGTLISYKIGYNDGCESVGLNMYESMKGRYCAISILEYNERRNLTTPDLVGLGYMES